MTTEARKPGAAAGGAKRTFAPSKQMIIVLASVMGVLLVGGIGLYVWQSGEAAKLRAQVRAKEEQVASGEKTAGRLISLESRFAETNGQLRNLESSVNQGEYVPTLLSQMESLAESVNLQVGSVRPTLEPAPAPPTDKEARKTFKPWPYDKIHIDMEVRGSYWNVAKLLFRLTEFPKIMAVESASVQSDPKVVTGKSPQLTVNVKLTGFIFKNDRSKPRPGAGQAAAAPAGSGRRADNPA
uniref:Type IV pilus biogenesis protein PilO n=1 Tax=uncultured Armatimonadetes bacterium TaxID=157466 RepID=A0A6J4IB01_9BACT|nr:hypothetical protein AVDCRST_MAG63-1733 [uncultured Armatimonadetes bacterium]